MIHLVLLMFVFIVLIGVIVAFVIFKPNLGSFKKMAGAGQKNELTISPTVTSAATTDLEKEVNAQELSDPANDFTQVDQDINSL
ncbi:MAG: hypothetical protein US39_C0001G0075 [Microgenomates group bacterium GW2011_GWC1_37_12b]|nr:MAG: hypothetical protein US39_C0001G0075 [Microgenomates group bacterium GW2011_GWC1_37_12b]